MATYDQIQQYVKDKYGCSIKTCWIADVKDIHGLKVRNAWNRTDIERRKYPCPKDKIVMIKEAFKYFGML